MGKLSEIRNGNVSSSKASKLADGIKDFTQAGKRISIPNVPKGL